MRKLALAAALGAAFALGMTAAIARAGMHLLEDMERFDDDPFYDDSHEWVVD